MTIILSAQKREVPTKEINILRKSGKIPAELYGENQTNQHLLLNKVIFDKVFSSAGESSLIDLSIGKDQPIKVLVQNIQKDPVTDNIIHVDFYQVDMTKPFTLEVPLEFTGESKAIKELEGTLVKNLSEIEISCLPNDLISHIDVDISSLNTFDDAIRVKDLKVPETITIKTDSEELVTAVVPKEIEEIPVAAVAVEGEAAVEGEEKEGKEEAKEGESAASDDKSKDKKEEK